MVERGGIDNLVIRISQAAGWEPLQVGVEDHQHQQTKHEGWEGCAHNAKDSCRLVDKTVMMDGRLHPQPDTDQDNRPNGPKRKIQSIRETTSNELRHGL